MPEPAVTTAIDPSTAFVYSRSLFPGVERLWADVARGTSTFSRFRVQATAALDQNASYLILPPPAGTRLFVVQLEVSNTGLVTSDSSWHFGGESTVPTPVVGNIRYLAYVRLLTSTAATFTEPLPGLRTYWLTAGDGLVVHKATIADGWDATVTVLWALVSTTG